MASQYKRLLAPTTLTASMQPPLEMIFDAGAFQTLEVEVRVLKAGSAGKIKLQHAATGDEPDSRPPDIPPLSCGSGAAGGGAFDRVDEAQVRSGEKGGGLRQNLAQGRQRPAPVRAGLRGQRHPQLPG